MIPGRQPLLRGGVIQPDPDRTIRLVVVPQLSSPLLLGSRASSAPAAWAWRRA